MLIKIRYPNSPSRSWFPLFKLDESLMSLGIQNEQLAYALNCDDGKCKYMFSG